MKKFTTIMLVLAGIFATIGLTCIILAFGMGLTTHDLWKMVRERHRIRIIACKYTVYILY